MKKTLFVLKGLMPRPLGRGSSLAILAVLIVMASCDFNNQSKSESNDPIYTDDGKPLVYLTIDTNNVNRALTTDLAQKYTDYYEVAFKDGDNYYRTAWHDGETGRILVPYGDYSLANNVGISTIEKTAIIFAGRYFPNVEPTLLAVGKLHSSTAVITASSTHVTFELEALENDITGNPSTFTVEDIGTIINKITYIKTSIDDQREFPVFAVKRNEINTAIYTITCPNSNGVIIAGSGIFKPRVVLLQGINPGFGGLDGITGSISPDAGAVSVCGGEFELTINIPDKDGIAAFSLEIPVCALNTSEKFPGIWHIRGGLRNAESDLGVTGVTGDIELSMGGQLFLAANAPNYVLIISNSP